MSVERGDFEGEWVVHLFKRRVRVYLGHSIYEGRRVQAWRSGSTRGVYVVPWGDRVAGVQWRPSDNDTRAVTRAIPDSDVFGRDAGAPNGSGDVRSRDLESNRTNPSFGTPPIGSSHAHGETG